MNDSPPRYSALISAEAVVAIDSFLEEFCTHFQNRRLAQIHRYYHDRPDIDSNPLQRTLPLPDPPF